MEGTDGEDKQVDSEKRGPLTPQTIPTLGI